MDTLKQTKLSKTKLITKRKVLSATMSGGLLMTSILVPTAYSLLEHQITAKADVLDIDLLSNVNASNTSGTTAENRWTSESGAQNVNFTISGSTLAGASLLNGQRYAVLAVPQELRGFVSPNGNTTVNTNITVDLNQVALLNTLVSAGDTFLNSVTTLLDSNPLASLDLTEVTRQLNLLKSVQSIGGGNFSATTSIDGTGALISAQLDDGLGQVLAQNLTTILTNLKNAINALQATGLAATVVNTALLPLKATFTAAVDVVLNPLINGTGDILSQLLNASVLGDTSITIPTTITPPTLQGPLDARFVGTAVKSNFLDVSILSNANGVSYVYLDGTNSATLVAPTGNLEATTSASGATDATADLPTTLKDSTGADVSVTSIITDSTGATVTNGSLGAGTYTVTYSAAGYDDVTQTLIVSDPSTTATLVASTGNLEATTSASGATDATADLPTTLKDSTGADVSVTSIITDSTGATVTNGSLGAGTYTVTYSAAGYDDVTQTLIVSDPSTTATLVASTGNLEATTSASGATDATADLPTTLKDSTGADVSVTSIITDSTGATVTNGSLGAGTYTVTYSAAGYDDVTQTLIVSDPSTTATLVAPTGNLEATTSASGATDATADLPTTLKDSTGADVSVTSIITDSTGATVTNGSLGVGTYTVTYSAAGYDDVTQTLIVSDPSDTTAPNAPVVTEVSGNSQIGYTVKGTAEPNAIVTIYDDANNQVGTAQANASGEFTVTLAGEVGPSSLLSITATDSSGNISDSANFNTPVDPIPGAPTATASGNSTNGYTVSGNAEANSTVTIKDLDGNILGTIVANDDGSYSVALPVGPRPEQTLEATATNSFGESSSTTFVTPMDPSLNAPSGTLTATTTAPGASDANAPILTELTDSNGNTVSVTAVIRDSEGEIVVNGQLAVGSYTVTYSAPGYADVTQILEVTDAPDTTAPEAPTVGGVTGNSTDGYVVSGTGEAGSTITIKDDAGNTVGAGTVDSEGNYSIEVPGSVGPDAPLTVTATDNSGNTSQPTSTTTPSDPDTTAPEAPTVGGVTGNSTDGYVVSGTGEAGSTITIKDDAGNTVGTGTVDSEGNYSIEVPGSVGPDAPLTVTATDNSGNTSQPTSTTTPSDPDTMAPEAPTVGGVTGNSTDGYVVSGTGEAGSTITIKDDAGNTVGAGTVDSEGNYSIEVPGSVGPDAPLTVTATDNSGNTSQPTSTTTPSDPDTTAPEAPTVTSVSGNSGKGYTIKGKAEAGALVNVYNNDNNLLGSVRADSNGSFTIVLPKGSVGANQPLTLTATDKSGNTSGKAYSVTPADQVIAPPSAVATGSSSKGYTISGYAGKEYAGGTVTIVVPAPQSKLFRANLALPGQVLGVATIDANGNYVLIVEPGAAYALEDLQAYTTYDGLVSVMTNFTTPADPTDTGGNTGNGNNNGNNTGTGGEGTGTGQPVVSDGSNGATSGQTGNGNGGLEATPISNSGTNAWGNGNTTPSLQSASGLTNSTSGKNFGTNSLPSTGEASTGWLGALGAFLLTSLGSLLFWRKKQ